MLFFVIYILFPHIFLRTRILFIGLPWWLSWWRIHLQCRKPQFEGSEKSPGEGIGYPLQYSWVPYSNILSDVCNFDKLCKLWAFLVTQMVKNPPAMQETWVWSLGWEDPLEEEMATTSSILAWKIPMDRGAWCATVHGVTKSQTQHTPHPFCCCFVQSICIYMYPFPCIFLFSYEIIFFLPEEPYFTFHFWKEKLFSFGMEFYIVNDLSPLSAPLLHLKDAIISSYVSGCLAAFRIFSLFLIFKNFTLMCLGVVFIIFIVLEFHRASLVFGFMSISWKILGNCFSLTFSSSIGGGVLYVSLILLHNPLLQP